ncbi:SAGA-associated factor 73 [Smittium mucronatum]|uniref:SAGA-associated factor 73 n=1 Tax=Smittium mucronatum TaxID=133383 RepID=A0A1R0GT74_9FUNG|nr:SAGA-associated factor 73 [Smittium mucronatum]
MEQFPFLIVCDSCGLSINAPYLKSHQELNCTVSTPKKDERKSMLNKAKEKNVEVATRKKDSLEGPDSTAPNPKTKRKLEQGPKANRKERTKRDDPKPRTHKRKASDMSEKSIKTHSGRKKQRQQDNASKTAGAGGAKKPAEFDLDKQCGVVVPPSTKQCTRSLTCKAHSMAMKRSVRGRSQPFDSLLQAHLAKSRTAKHARNVDVSNSTRRANGGAGGEGMGGQDDSENEDQDSEQEAQHILGLMWQYEPKPLATKVNLMPRRRQHYLRVHDLFLDAMTPNQKSIIQANKQNYSQSGSGGFGLGDGASVGSINFLGPQSVAGNGVDVPFTSVATVATVHTNPSMMAMMSTLRMAVGNRSSMNTGLSGPKQQL